MIVGIKACFIKTSVFLNNLLTSNFDTAPTVITVPNISGSTYFEEFLK